MFPVPGFFFMSTRSCQERVTRDVRFAGLPGAVRLVLPKQMLDEALAHFALWPHSMVSPQEKPLLVLRLETESEKQCQMQPQMQAQPWGRQETVVNGDGPCVLEGDPTLDFGMRRETGLAAGLCSLAIAMVAHLCRAGDLMCLHGALLARPNNRTGGLLLLAGNRGGKSTLAVRLMAEGLRCYGDDMVGLAKKGSLVGLGLAPRLRLPLPASKILADFAHERAASGDERAFFLRPEGDLVAPFGAECLPGHIVILKREHSPCSATLTTLGAGAALSELVFHFFLQPGTALEALERAKDMAASVPCLRLRYHDLDAACALLLRLCDMSVPADAGKDAGKDAGEDWPQDLFSLTCETDCSCQTEEESPLAPQALEDEEQDTAHDVRIDPLQDYCQREGSLLWTHLGRDFLVNRERDGLYAMNTTARVLWLMLAQPLSPAEAGLLLGEAYPKVAKERIRRDVRDLFADLLAAGLIEPVAEPGPESA